MKELLPTLIGLFGTIAALVIGFIILLYDSSKKWVDNSKKAVLEEINNFLSLCRTNRATGTLKNTDALHQLLTDDYRHSVITPDNVNAIISLLETKIFHLRNDNIENLPEAEVGKNAKDAAHLEKYHKNDIKKAYESFIASNKLYDNFPKLTKQAIGVPIFLSAFFVIIYPYKNIIENKIGTNAFDIGCILITLLGLYFIYVLTTKTLKTLIDIK